MKESDTRESIINRRGYRKNIIGSKLSLYISSYPTIVKYLKQRIGNSTKVLGELCCGIGVTLEYIAEGFMKVIGVDFDEKIINECKENLKNAGLIHKSILILGDINDDETLKKIKADIIIYDIPFWSPHESMNQEDLTKKNPALKSIIKRIREHITENIIIFCSPEFDYNTIKDNVGSCEFQKVFINKKHDRNLVYLGYLKQRDGITELRLNT